MARNLGLITLRGEYTFPLIMPQNEIADFEREAPIKFVVLLRNRYS